jgi:hypothetical protein
VRHLHSFQPTPGPPPPPPPSQPKTRRNRTHQPKHPQNETNHNGSQSSRGHRLFPRRLFLRPGPSQSFPFVRHLHSFQPKPPPPLPPARFVALSTRHRQGRQRGIDTSTHETDRLEGQTGTRLVCPTRVQLFRLQPDCLFRTKSFFSSQLPALRPRRPSRPSSSIHARSLVTSHERSY